MYTLHLSNQYIIFIIRIKLFETQINATNFYRRDTSELETMYIIRAQGLNILRQYLFNSVFDPFMEYVQPQSPDLKKYIFLGLCTVCFFYQQKVFDQLTFKIIFTVYRRLKYLKISVCILHHYFRSLQTKDGTRISRKEKLRKEKLFKCVYLSLFIITKLSLKSESLVFFKLNQLIISIKKKSASNDHKPSLKILIYSCPCCKMSLCPHNL